ncbi:hypothetical protein FB567DRAFT_178182 [Paraphoma chrysanthemicola]|uniref:WW domain-containing protein n=1 Tax=Paraphoma chrysanthemicola TaxID=798071 RepID=A0A8K0RFZ1_9PLEO|nr:hypothetical protein FB567DRAFT_178182 [Paraphoma chrysanthemicola]
MNYNLAIPSPVTPGNLVLPNGWKAEWSAQYARYFYVNIHTKESTWALPALPESQQAPQPLQRKPVPTQSIQAQSQSQSFPTSAKTSYVESYPTPPPQVMTGYFPAPNQQPQYSVNQVPSSQQPYIQAASPTVSIQGNPQQQFPSAQPYAPQIAQYAPAPQHHGPAQRHFASGHPVQYQQQSYPTPAATPVSIYTPPNAPSAPQFQQMSPPITPNSMKSPHQNGYVPGSCNQPNITNNAHTNQPFKAGASPINAMYSPNANNINQPSQQRPITNVYQAPQQPPAQQYQQNAYVNQTYSQPQHQSSNSHRTSMMSGNFPGGGMMSKMSSKFTQLQTRATGPPAHGQANAKPASDWKKWAKRGAIGVAGIGALALGVDAAGDMLSGAAGMDAAVGADFSGGGGDFTGGGGDFSGGGFEGDNAAGAMDAQTAVDANAAQHAMEGIGQDNAQMLLDPVGTEYTMVNDATATGSAQIGYGLI